MFRPTVGLRTPFGLTLTLALVTGCPQRPPGGAGTGTVASPSPSPSAQGSPAPGDTATGQHPTPPTPPGSAHRGTVFVVVMENHSYEQLVDNPAAPYLNELIARYGLATNYTDDGHHPSLPNYLELVSGSTWGIRDDSGPDVHKLAHDHLGAQLDRAGVPWRAYMETMVTPCRTHDTYRYAVRHDPFVYFNDLRDNPARCAARVVDASALPADLAADTYRFIWITPNLCDDAHDCAEQHGDDWLRQTVPTLLASPGYLAGGTLFITWDEGEHGSERIATVVVSERLPSHGFRSTVRHGHASLLATLEDMLGVPRLADAVTTPSMDEFFQGGITPR